MAQQQQLQLTQVAGSSGVATITLPPLVGVAEITVGIINVLTNSTNDTVASILLNGLPVTQTADGNMDTASGWPPLPVTAKDSLQVQWTGCNSGDQCQAVVYWTIPPTPGQGQRSQTPVPGWQEY